MVIMKVIFDKFPGVVSFVTYYRISQVREKMRTQPGKAGLDNRES